MKWLSLPFLFFLLGVLPASAAVVRSPEIKILDATGAPERSFAAFPSAYTGGFSIAAGDLGSDGTAEIVVGSGIGSEPRVKILRQDGSLITSFLAYAPTFGRGIRVAVGDVDGDRLNEIITGTGYGGGPHIRIFDGTGQSKLPGFFAYDPAFRGGVFITIRDLNNDGRAEIITGAGPNGGPHVRIFDASGILQSEFFAFAANDAGGVTVGTADIDGDQFPEIVVGHASTDEPVIKFFERNGRERWSLALPFVKGTGSVPRGVTPFGADVDGDGREEIILMPNGGLPSVSIFRPDGQIAKTVTPFESDFSGAIQFIPLPNIDGTPPRFLAAPARPNREGRIDLAKSIVVKLNEQRLYAFEHGLLANTFLISSGIPRFPTPPGTYQVQKKIPIKDYVWTYGPNSPDNYALRNVKLNLQFRPNYYLHYAYWHNNFGRVMSHGCVNMPLEPSKWVYDWAQVGTPVFIQ